jgi:hypothetical protein
MSLPAGPIRASACSKNGRGGGRQASSGVIQAPQTGEDVQIDPLDLADVVVATRPAPSAHSIAAAV